MDGTAGIYARESQFLGRYVQLGIAQGRVLSVEFPGSVDDVETGHELLDRVEAYLAGEEDNFEDVTLAMTMPTARRDIYEAVREVPYGEEASLEQITMMVPGKNSDDGSDLEAVRDALAQNPIPVFIPTHRVRGTPVGMHSDIAEKLRSVEGL